MPNFSGIFGRRPAVRLDSQAISLNTNLRTYVNAYVKARNSNNANAMPPINSKIVNSLKRYINTKRPSAAGAAAAAVNNTGGSNNNAAAAAAGVMNAQGASPANIGAAAAKPLLVLGAPPNQVAAAAAGAAKQQALSMGQGSNEANSVAANAAAEAVNNAAPNATPNQAANAASAGAAAAGLPANNQAQAAANAAAAAEPNLPGGSGGVNMNTLKGAIAQNVNKMSIGEARQGKLLLNRIISKVGTIDNANLKTKVNNYRRRLNNKISIIQSRQQALTAESQLPQAQRPTRPNLEKTIEASNGRSIVLIRANNKARWNFKNNANKNKYNLNGRNTNNPTIRNINVGTGNLFKQEN